MVTFLGKFHLLLNAKLLSILFNVYKDVVGDFPCDGSLHEHHEFVAGGFVGLFGEVLEHTCNHVHEGIVVGKVVGIEDGVCEVVEFNLTLGEGSGDSVIEFREERASFNQKAPH